MTETPESQARQVSTPKPVSQAQQAVDDQVAVSLRSGLSAYDLADHDLALLAGSETGTWERASWKSSVGHARCWIAIGTPNHQPSASI